MIPIEEEMKGKVAIITGANTGIGFGCAKVFSEAGMNVVMAARRKEKGEAAAAELNAAGKGECTFFQCDVSDPDQVEYAIAEPNGQISVAQRATQRQATTRELGLEPPEPGIMHLIIHDGVINDRNLTLAGRDRRWLDQLLAAHRLTPDRVFLLLTDDGGTVRILPRRTS